MHILVNAKAYVALVGSIATALLAVYGADTPVGHWLTVVSVVATAVGTWAVPNQSPTLTVPEYFDHDEHGQGSATLILLVMILLGVVLLLFGIRS